MVFQYDLVKTEMNTLSALACRIPFKNNNIYGFCFPDCKHKYMLIAEKNHCVLLQLVFVKCLSGRRRQLNRAETWAVVNFWAHTLRWNRHDQAELTAY